MTPVILESPYAGDVEANVAYARRCMLDCLRRGEAPFASHLLYTQCLDDTVGIQRGLGIDAGFAWLVKAERSVVYVDRGLSAGMLAGISCALDHNIPVWFRTLTYRGVSRRVGRADVASGNLVNIADSVRAEGVKLAGLGHE